MSWDLSLVETEYAFMAREFRGKGISVLLGPISGPLGRSPYGGRQYETFGADPYLNGKM
jgi:beta-glucosidase